VPTNPVANSRREREAPSIGISFTRSKTGVNALMLFAGYARQ